MLSLEALLERCRVFRPGDAEDFRQIVGDVIVELGLRQRELAAYLKVTPSTVSRWSHEQQLPRPRIQAAFIRQLERRIAYAIRLKQQAAA